ncbi:MAG: hypothetical protein U0X73_05690 [Thermoanaerobaculia bacterium]
MSARILPFGTWSAESAAVGTVHRDGSITFAGVVYRTIAELPPQCTALRIDVETHVQWKKLYHAISRRTPGTTRDGDPC